MAKSDFEFYEVPGVTGQFVIPAQASDPYGGQFNFENLEQESVGQIAGAIERVTGTSFEPATQIVPRSDLEGYFFSMIPTTAEVAGRVIKAEIELKSAGDSYWSEELNAILEGLDDADKVIGRSDIIAKRELLEVFTHLYDSEENPRHPYIRMRQIIPVQAYRWLPGPYRRSETKGSLPPTYSPRPINLAIAQLVEIVGINSEVAPASKPA